MVTRYIVICGNPVDGLRFFGPFVTQAEAEHWVDKSDGDYWITELHGDL